MDKFVKDLVHSGIAATGAKVENVAASMEGVIVLTLGQGHY